MRVSSPRPGSSGGAPGVLLASVITRTCWPDLGLHRARSDLALARAAPGAGAPGEIVKRCISKDGILGGGKTWWLFPLTELLLVASGVPCSDEASVATRARFCVRSRPSSGRGVWLYAAPDRHAHRMRLWSESGDPCSSRSSTLGTSVYRFRATRCCGESWTDFWSRRRSERLIDHERTRGRDNVAQTWRC